MRLSLILSVFDRNFVLSVGGEVQQHDVAELEDVELHSQTEVARIGFRPNDDEDWEDG